MRAPTKVTRELRPGNYSLREQAGGGSDSCWCGVSPGQLSKNERRYADTEDAFNYTPRRDRKTRLRLVWWILRKARVRLTECAGVR